MKLIKFLKKRADENWEAFFASGDDKYSSLAGAYEELYKLVDDDWEIESHD